MHEKLFWSIYYSTISKSMKVDQDSVTERPSRLEEEAITGKIEL